MERFESLGPVGEGSYGTVLKCRHRDSGRLVAIKKFMDSDDDKTVKKIALREIKLLRQLRHDNLVSLLEVWKRRHRWYLVFEFVDRTLLDDLEENPNGLDLNTGRQYLYQILRAADFCHQQNVIHRDIKPENILISHEGVVKLCDFGFARTVASPSDPGVYTDYVATRWYRAPELLVGDIKYGKPVDVWAVGCLLVEMLTGQPLFPGESDLDQIYHIVRCFGNLTTHHQELFYRNPVFSGVKLPECSGPVPLQQRFPAIAPAALDLAKRCLEMDPGRRAQCSELSEHPLFTQDSFHNRFLDELNAKVQKEHRENSTLPEITKMPRQRDKGDGKKRKGKGKKNREMNEKIKKDKMERTKGKQPSNVFKINRNTNTERLLTKQCKPLGHKAICHGAQSSMTVKRKPGKAAGAESRKESDVSQRKTQISESADATKKNNNPKAAKPQHETVVLPEPKDQLTSVKPVDCSGPGVEINIVKIRRLSKLQPSQEFTKTWRNSKQSKNPIADSKNVILSPKTASESVVNQTNTNLARQCFQLSSNKPKDVSVSTLVFPSKTCQKTGASEFQKTETHQRSSECPKVLTLDYKTTSNSGPKSTKNSSSLLTGPSKTPTSDLSELPSTIFVDSGPVHISAARLKRMPEVSKPDCTFKKTLSKVQELVEDKGEKRNHGCMKMNQERETVQISSSVNPKSQSTKISTEDHVTSASMPNENESTLKVLAVSNQENEEDLIAPISVTSTMNFIKNPTLKVSGSSGKDEKNNLESDLKSFKVSHPKHNLTKSGHFSNHMRSTVTPKTTPEKNYTTNTSTVGDLTSVTFVNHKASTRNFALQDSDTTELNKSDFSVLQSSPPPPLLLPPSSISPASSVVNSNSPDASDCITEGAAFHPGNQRLQCMDAPRDNGSIYGRPSNMTRSLTFRVSENTPLFDHSFQSHHGNLGNDSSFTGHATHNKSQVHFPDLRSSMSLELRGREGKHNKDNIKDQKKEKHLVPSRSPSEAQQQGLNYHT